CSYLHILHYNRSNCGLRDHQEIQYDFQVSTFLQLQRRFYQFDKDLLRVKDVELGISKIAGVRIPALKGVVFDERPYDLFSSPAWLSDGVEVLKEIARLGIEFEVFQRRTELLDHARKKTTQKVNLYEKVQIPGYEDAIRKIKRFLEDEENLSKSAQKIVKTKHEQNADTL
ncbi:MAG: hypothetical protein II358_05010, partial [Tidjanibacter sp.]|nr:hypothetical protein [Tidjanibacter sp.]